MKFLESVGGRKFIGFIIVIGAIVLLGKMYHLDAKELIAGILGAYVVLAGSNIAVKKILNGGKNGSNG